MSEQRIQELMRAVAEPVEPPTLAETSWRAAGGRIRRNRRIGMSVTAAAVAVVALVAGTWRPADDSKHPAAPPTTLTSVGHTPVTVLPAGGESRLPQASSSVLPDAIDTNPAHAVPLSEDPVNAAVGLFAPYPKDWPHNPPKIVTVLVLGDDGRMRRIDTVAIRGTRDGLSPAPIVAGALNGAGTEAAFPQPDGTVLTVDLRGTGFRRYHVGGWVESVFWAGNDGHRIGVVREDRTDMVRVPSGGVVRRFPGTGIALPQRGMWSRVMTLTGQSAGSGTYHAPELDVWEWQDKTHMTSTKLTLPNTLNRWYGAAFTDGTRVVRTTFGSPSSEGTGESVVAVRRGMAQPLRILSLPYGSDRGKLCCSVLGWPEGNAVLVDDHSAPEHHILAWNLRTGKVWRVATLSQDAQVSLVSWIRLPDYVSR